MPEAYTDEEMDIRSKTLVKPIQVYVPALWGAWLLFEAGQDFCRGPAPPTGFSYFSGLSFDFNSWPYFHLAIAVAFLVVSELARKGSRSKPENKPEHDNISG